ncbi:MAG: GTPase HflX [Fusobacteriaceae bacterium]|jgi:GTP-binding protein HflX|nr:GTPase HflX [Fusobacteriaceae bacterium]
MIQGNIEGIREAALSFLNALFEIKLDKDRFVSRDILLPLAEISAKINREISVSMDRRGHVTEISVGDDRTASLPVIAADGDKLSGIRIFHTHPNGDSRLSDVDVSALLKLKLDAMAAVGVNDEGKITGISVGFCERRGENFSCRLTRSLSLSQAENLDFLRILEELDAPSGKKGFTTEREQEAAVLVGIENEGMLDELEELAKACGIRTAGRFLQKRSKPDNVTFLGSGKARELSLYKQVQKADLVIFDDELSGIQARNLEAILGCRVIDRTVLILEIFARRAVTREGKIQVRLAELKYSGAKLIGAGVSMSRAGFGIRGGAGETKLETDRRRIRDEINALRKELQEIQKTRALRREKRDRSGVSRIALVGYTNAGKSTLRNLLTREYPADCSAKGSEAFAEDMLFATLDTTTRSIALPSRRILSVTDTVGFIRKLPHDLVEAFKSTLDEVSYADLLVHVVDGESGEIPEEVKAVEAVLAELSADTKPTVLALNKIDKMTPEKISAVKEAFGRYNIVEISAKQNKGVDSLLKAIEALLPQKTKRENYRIPYGETALVAYLHRNAIVENEEFEEAGVFLSCVVGPEVSGKMERFRVENAKKNEKN